EAGRRAVHVVVTAQTATGTLQALSDDGKFSFDAMPSGTTTLTATTADRATIEPLRLELSDTDESRDVRLVVSPDTMFEGVVQSTTGPILGARVWCVPSMLQSLVAPQPTDVDGRFRVRVPPLSTAVALSVAAPGFAVRLMRLPIPEEPLQVLLQQTGGSLVIDAAITENARPYLVHDGVIVDAFAFAYLARARVMEDSPRRLHIVADLIEEGVYSLCVMAHDDAVLAENGRLPPDRCTSASVIRGVPAVLRR
ncbi:MAG: hypothetical protein ACLGH0_11265, partial [Thermoanaerobaculia bacterium]